MYSSFSEKKALIIDNGTATTKIGFANEEIPRLVFPTVVGYPLDKNKQYSRDYFIGEEAIQLKDELEIITPIENGIIKNWSAMEKIWAYIFSILGIESWEYPVLLSEVPLNTNSNREKAADIMFNYFNVSSLYFIMTPILSLYASGRITGCVVEVGEVTHIVPILEGFAIKNAIKRIEFGGKDIDFYLLELIKEKKLNSKEESYIIENIRNIKEEICYVIKDASDFYSRGQTLIRTILGQDQTPYITAEGDIFLFDSEPYSAPECIFDPSRIKKDFDPLHKEIVNAILECEVELRRDLFENIVLSGGTSMIPGIETRLSREIKTLIPESYDVRIIGQDIRERNCKAWIGGAIVGDLEHFYKQSITKKEYKFRDDSRIFNRFDLYYGEEEIVEEEIGTKNKIEYQEDLEPIEDIKLEIQNFLEWANDKDGLAGFINYYLQANNSDIISELAKIYSELRNIIES